MATPVEPRQFPPPVSPTRVQLAIATVQSIESTLREAVRNAAPAVQDRHVDRYIDLAVQVYCAQMVAREGL